MYAKTKARKSILKESQKRYLEKIPFTKKRAIFVDNYIETT